MLAVLIWAAIGGYILYETMDVPKLIEDWTTAEAATAPATPKATLQAFFTDLNNKDYEAAFARTDHEDWGNYSKFKENPFWADHTDFTIKHTSEKYYHSVYGGTSVLYAWFTMTDTMGQVIDQDYDFHFKEVKPGEWRIVRMIEEK